VEGYTILLASCNTRASLEAALWVKEEAMVSRGGLTKLVGSFIQVKFTMLIDSDPNP